MAAAAKASVGDRAKELLADPRDRIRLDDFVNEHLRTALAALATDHFPVSGGGTKEDFVKRLAAYEDAIGDLLDIMVLVTRWGELEARNQLEKIFLRMAESANTEGGGTNIWLHARWYPLVLLIYAAGITALFTRRYDLLAAITMPRVKAGLGSGVKPLAAAALGNVTDVADWFKFLPELAQRRF